jgi:Cu+-exporting ATPase
MVGDGVNDAAAMAEADLGVAMARATDVAAGTASVVLLRQGLSALPDLFGVSARVLAVIRQNLAWAFFFNLIGIPLAAFGVLPPMFAALAMSASSVIVVSNSLRIRTMSI